MREIEEVIDELGVVKLDINSVIKKLEKLNKEMEKKEHDEWCEDCKEYDQENHCCHRFTKFIRETVDELKGINKTNNISYKRSSAYDYDKLYFKSRQTADEVLCVLQKLLAEKGIITIADYYVAAGQIPEIDYYEFGWRNLDHAFIFSWKYGNEKRWGIHFPEAIYKEYLKEDEE